MTVDARVMYQDPQSRQKTILVINQAIHINGQDNHLMCPMKCCLNDVHINEVPKFLYERPIVTTHAIKLPDPFNTAHTFITTLQLSRVTSSFDVHSLSIAECENEDIPRIHLTAEESP